MCPISKTSVFLCLFLVLCSVLHATYAYAEWDAFSDEMLRNELAKRQLVPQPRVGRAFWEMKRQGIIPAPRVGRSFNTWLAPAAAASAARAQQQRHMQQQQQLHAASTRSKRSPHDSSTLLERAIDDAESSKNFGDWLPKAHALNAGMADAFHRDARQLIPAPRVGRRSGESAGRGFDLNTLLGSYFASGNSIEEGEGVERDVDPIDLQLRAVYIPRFGKRASYGHGDGFLKRAAFTPRIGRAVAFTPRLGRSSWSDAAILDSDDGVVEGRQVRAAFTPRIGRSVLTADKAGDATPN